MLFREIDNLMINDYLSLSTLTGFNKSVEHLRVVTGIIKSMKEGKNLADIVMKLEDERQINKAQIGPILNSVLIERSNYANLSLNLPIRFSDFKGISKTTLDWKDLDIILAYHHPQQGVTLINPKNNDHWERVQDVYDEELMVIYVKSRKKDNKQGKKAARVLAQIFNGSLKASEATL